MKKYLSSLLFLLVSVILIGTSCKKDGSYPSQPEPPSIITKVRFILYTADDFSADNNTIVFKPFIQNSKHETIWDSAFAPMKIKDVPDKIHSIVFDKEVGLNSADILGVGFNYDEINIGRSWKTDTCKTGQSLKVLEFSFH